MTGSQSQGRAREPAQRREHWCGAICKSGAPRPLDIRDPKQEYPPPQDAARNQQRGTSKKLNEIPPESGTFLMKTGFSSLLFHREFLISSSELGGIHHISL